MRRPVLVSAAAVLVVSLAVYVPTMAPGLTWAHHGTDGGDLITAACRLGVPHPTGYPLYVALGHLFCRLLPIGEAAWRLNLFSAICAAGAASLLAAATAAHTSTLAGLVSGLVFALGRTVWSQAVIAEVYSLNALAVASLLCLVLAPGGRARQRWAVGLVWGLGWTTHLTSALLLPLVVWHAWRHRAHPKPGCALWHAQLGAALPYLVGWLLGLTPFVLLPVLAARQPVVNWGNPVSLGGWWWLVSGALYRGYQFGLEWIDLPGRLVGLIRVTVQQLTLPGLGLLVWGIFHMYVRRRGLTLAVLSAGSLVVAYAVGYNTGDSYLLMCPAWLLGAFLIGVAIEELVRTDVRCRRWRALALTLPLYLLLTGWALVGRGGDDQAARFGRMVMELAPSNALVYTATDAHTFGLWYYRFVLQTRTDLTIVHRDMLSESWYQQMLVAQDPQWRDSSRPSCTVSDLGIMSCDR